MAPANISEKNLEILVTAWGQCAEGLPKVDYGKLADLLGYKTAASATTAYHKAKTQFLANAHAANGEKAPATPKTPKSAASKKRAAPVDDGGDDEETAETKPKPEPKKKGRGGKKAKTETEVEPDDEITIKGEAEIEDGALDELMKGAEEYAKDE